MTGSGARRSRSRPDSALASSVALAFTLALGGVRLALRILISRRRATMSSEVGLMGVEGRFPASRIGVSYDAE